MCVAVTKSYNVKHTVCIEVTQTEQRERGRGGEKTINPGAEREQGEG